MPQPPFEGPLSPTLLKIIRGTPTAEELAVLTVLLTNLASAGTRPDAEPARAAAVWDRPADCSPVSWAAGR